MTRPTILVTNDDGFEAPGLRALVGALEAAELGQIVVVAPERERSAIGHAISLHKPLRLKEVSPWRFWCSGTPTDCVYIAMHHILSEPPALVVSGINGGANLGDDVTYSGTVGAAMEALLMDLPAVALSLASGRRFEEAAQVSARVCRMALERGVPGGCLLNVNLPAGVDAQTPWRVARLGKRNYGRQVSRNLDPRGKPYYWIGGAHLGFEDIEGSDCNAIQDGFVSLTPVHLRLTDDAALGALASWASTPQGE